MSTDKGWIKVYRNLNDSDIWLDSEPFDRRSAWIDILLMVNHEDKKVRVGSEFVTIKRGQKLTSIRKLAEKWHWSRGKVQRYLKLLMSDNMIIISGTLGGTLLTVVNYGFYQTVRDTKRDTNGTATGHRRDSDGSQTRMIKNIYKNEKEESPPAEEDDDGEWEDP